MVSNVNCVWLAVVCAFLVPCLISGRPSLIPSMYSRGMLWKLTDIVGSGKSFSSKSGDEFSSKKSPTKGKETDLLSDLKPS